MSTNAILFGLTSAGKFQCDRILPFLKFDSGLKAVWLSIWKVYKISFSGFFFHPRFDYLVYYDIIPLEYRILPPYYITLFIIPPEYRIFPPYFITLFIISPEYYIFSPYFPPEHRIFPHISPQNIVAMDQNVTCSICSPNAKDAAEPAKNFTFDGAYGTDSTTENIYNDVAFSIVEVKIISIVPFYL